MRFRQTALQVAKAFANVQPESGSFAEFLVKQHSPATAWPGPALRSHLSNGQKDHDLMDRRHGFERKREDGGKVVQRVAVEERSAPGSGDSVARARKAELRGVGWRGLQEQ